MSAITDLYVAKITAYIARTPGMTERKFGLAVANNHKLVPRLREKFAINSNTQDRIDQFIAGVPLAPLKSRRRAICSGVQASAA